MGAQAKHLLDQMDQLIRNSVAAPNPRHPELTTHATYVVDESAYQPLRHKIGLLLAK